MAEYLTTSEGDDAINYMDYGLQLGRRFRALKLWMVIRAFGSDGIAERIRHHCQLAQTFAGWVRAAGDGWAVCAPVPFSTVCFRHYQSVSSWETTHRAKRSNTSRRAVSVVSERP